MTQSQTAVNHVFGGVACEGPCTGHIFFIMFRCTHKFDVIVGCSGEGWVNNVGVTLHTQICCCGGMGWGEIRWVDCKTVLGQVKAAPPDSDLRFFPAHRHPYIHTYIHTFIHS